MSLPAFTSMRALSGLPSAAGFLYAVLLLAGCTTQTAPPTPPQAKPDAVQSRPVFPPVQKSQKRLQRLLRDAETAASPERELYLLQATELLRQKDAWEEAGRLLDRVQSRDLPEQLASRFNALQLERLLRTETPADALLFLSGRVIREEELGPDGRVRMALLRADVQAANDRHLEAARELALVHAALPEAQQAENTERLWASLMEVPGGTLEREAQKASTYEMRGWLSLAELARKHQDNVRRQWRQFRSWQLAWGKHPATTRPPASLATLADSVRDEPRKIALLLPMTGPLARNGAAIRDGFMAAHFSQQGVVREFRLYDSAAGRLSGLLKRAVADGAEFIIGPLARDKVAEVAGMNLQGLPVLALNRVTPPENDSFFQLALTADDEIRQLVELAVRRGHKRALLIYPGDRWGERDAASFQAQAEELGLEIAALGGFLESDDYRPYVGRLLGVADSEARAGELRNVLGGASFEFTPRRRQDLDMVALVADPKQARGINPALAYLYAEDVPIYSISRINAGKLTEIEYLDLNGVYFCDLPFNLLKDNPLRREIIRAWPQSEGQLAPFYALGIDAYHLLPRISQMARNPAYRHYGATGTLQVDEAGRVRRRLLWAQVREGKVETGSQGD